jgi:hypothetical protein
MSGELPEIDAKQMQKYADETEALVRECYKLGVETQSQVLVIASWHGKVVTWATDMFEPLVAEEQGRKVIASMLKDQVEEAAKRAAVELELSKKAESQQQQKAENQNDDDRNDDDSWAKDIVYLEDDKLRFESFKEHLVNALRGVHEIPQLYEGGEACTVIASPSGKIFSHASPALKPLVESKTGRGMLMALLKSPDAAKYLQENAMALHMKQQEAMNEWRQTSSTVQAEQRRAAAAAADDSPLSSSSGADEAASTSTTAEAASSDA